MQRGRDTESFNCQPLFDGSNAIAVIVDAELFKVPDATSDNK